MRTGKWTDKEVEVLREVYPDTPTPEVARIVNRSVLSVRNKVALLGLKKDPLFLEQEKPGQIRPGQTPWNKGKPFNPGGRSEASRFRAGQKPATTQPVGAIVEDPDGYLKQKISDEATVGSSKRNWRYLHIMEWEKHNGPLPKGWIVRFADGNNRNFDPGNLVAVSRQENAVINRWLAIDDMPKGGLYSLALAARVKMKARDRQRGAA